MIKSHQSETKSSACWSKEAQVPSLRVELSDDIFFVLPYIHFLFAKLEQEKEHTTLLLSFSTHEVRIVGKNLKELGIAIQRLSVEWIKETSSRYATVTKKEVVLIQKIEVTEMSKSDGGQPS